MDQIYKIEKELKTELSKKPEKEGNEFNFTFN